ncbi:autotransporter domain-containing protein [Pseudomonas sp. ABC1]|uniref:autotransporter family protein n=1 Tax=Pseudomonas sp. ABC1 TaxID=2748080 RepID=UPI0015C30A46|nr:autotransporter outer membrane beta-barrel domain-containing protein [Pseudomonas sp. ABC1]QLF93684.1 autotransporter domain-containing protein [Pseudomonas sp. ABC1]
MIPSGFRKTLLALAVTGTALPALAQTVQLTDSGLLSENLAYTDSLEIVGAFNGSASDAVRLTNVSVAQELVLDAAIENAAGNGVVFEEVFGDNTVLSSVGGDLLNKGDISVQGNGSQALKIEQVGIQGSLVNQGNLTVQGSGSSGVLSIQNSTIAGNLHNQGSIGITGLNVSALDIRRDTYLVGSLINSGLIEAQGLDDPIADTVSAVHIRDSAIGGDILNEAGATIRAVGLNSNGISLQGAALEGRLINDGTIEVVGDGFAIDLYQGFQNSGSLEWLGPTRLKQLVNNGSIIGHDEESIAILVDGVIFTGEGPGILNNGLIQSVDDAIAFDPNGLGRDNASLVIENNGDIISQANAIDASYLENGERIYLDWNSGRIEGNLIDLVSINIMGDVAFSGTDSTQAGANIRIKDGGWIDIGDSYAGVVGHLELEQAHTLIDGNLNLAGLSSLGMTLSNATDTNRAVLEVSGTLEFDEGSLIRLAAQGEDFSPSGSQYILAKAGTLDDQGLSVVSSSALLRVDTYGSENDQVTATVSLRSGTEIEDIVAGNGGSVNAGNALKSFGGVLGQLEQSDPVLFQAFANADQARLARLAAELAPDTQAAVRDAAQRGLQAINTAAGNRTASLRRGLSSGDGLSRSGVWTQALYGESDQGRRDGIAGYNAYSRGIAIGADGKLDDRLTLGLAYGYIDTDVNGSNSSSRTEIESHTFSLYGGFEQGPWFADAALTYGLNDNQGRRQIAGTLAKSDYDSQSLGMSLVGGYAYRMSERVVLEPRLAARYSQVDIDGYREKGSSAALQVDSQRYEVAELGAGFRVAADYPLAQGRLEPQLRLMAYHDFAADSSRSTSTFLVGGTPFVTSGASPVRNSYEASAGLAYHLGAMTLGVSYDHTGKSGFDADTFAAKVRYDF